MARPRQWAKKFTNIHSEMRHAYGNYKKRYNNKLNSMSMAKRGKQYKPALFKSIRNGAKYNLFKTPKNNYTNKFGKRMRTPPSGKKVWRRFR